MKFSKYELTDSQSSSKFSFNDKDQRALSAGLIERTKHQKSQLEKHETKYLNKSFKSNGVFPGLSNY